MLERTHYNFVTCGNRSEYKGPQMPISRHATPLLDIKLLNFE